MYTLIDDEMLMKVAGLLGEEAVRIVEVLKETDEITDNEIASRTEIQLNTVRKVLYQLYEHSLIALRRTRDKETGWFIFHWRLQPDQIEGYILNKKRRVLEKLENRLEYEKNHDFYFCRTPHCKKIPFEEAIELFFKCPNCDKPLMHFENSHFIEVLNKKVELLRKELSE